MTTGEILMSIVYLEIVLLFSYIAYDIAKEDKKSKKSKDKRYYGSFSY